MPVLDTSSNNTTTTMDLVATLTPEYLEYLNNRLSKLSPQKILEWAIVSLPNLYQTTAFGLTGCVIMDMVAKVSEPFGEEGRIPLIFIDTLHHFDETISLTQRSTSRYNALIHIIKPAGVSTRDEFTAKYGASLWSTDAELYDYLVKVEPARRAYDTLNVRSVITGRRRSQKGERGEIPIIEVDHTQSPPIIKLNPLALWDYKTVWEYIQENNVPYNVLHDQGYKSVGDYHSTEPVKEGEDERAGRWKGQEKTECGLHKDYFQQRRNAQLAQKRALAQKNLVQ
ncbi:phosphoadenylyl-sulfate reductase (thioredoxin) [Synchytrium microbalum]|uniref:Phosphoadenylyl-sulfate reductase (Thioredoxin) n=1 Tax=Synchytrium microbalum TaxID=1806994 RepID=A0A507C1T7_9FUNG|nr:phosphoadenylyl-sulfate reductase (thioredoxin) [Synchytrium microbalum]TPX31916.1 phosphoadenylyl-sulfate reductase (thioredoxin) [Synchytrium microbalum]